MLSIAIPKQNGVGSTHRALSRSSARRTGDRSAGAGEFAPRVDVVETRDSVVVRVELPGLSSDDIDVNLERDILTVKAERKAPEPGDAVLYHRSEIAYGAFSRAFTLPAVIDRDAIDAAYNDGILTVTLPKAEESKPRSIDVKVV